MAVTPAAETPPPPPPPDADAADAGGMGLQAQVIDGSKGEGGGQILRNSVSYAAILGKEIRVNNIRAKRSKPGLQAQHAVALQLAADVCGGQLDGNKLQSSEIHYKPPPPPTTTTTNDAKDNDKARSNDATPTKEREFLGEIKTAGSICLLLQAALPCALLGFTSAAGNSDCQPLRLILKGGTNASMAPPIDYWARVFWPILQRNFGLGADQVESRIIRRGYFPRGGGQVDVRVVPIERGKPLNPMHLTERGHVTEIYIRSYHAGKLPRHLAQQMAKAARSYLQRKQQEEREGGVIPPSCKKYEMDIATESNAVGSGLGILVVAKTSTGCMLAGSAICAPKTKAADAGVEAAAELYSTLRDGGCVDEWLQDQLILYMALASGTSELLTGSLTLHTKTAIAIAEMLSGATFEITRLNEEEEEAGATTTTTDGSAAATGDGTYGQAERTPGRHLIKCHGIGFVRDDSSEEKQQQQKQKKRQKQQKEQK